MNEGYVLMENHRSIGKWLSVIHRHGRAFIGQRLMEHGIGGAQFPYFMMLLKRDGQNQEEISRFFHVDKATAGRAIRKLMDAGYVERRRNPNDRRAYQVFLTEDGRRLKPIIMHILREFTEIVTSDFSPGEFELMLTLLERMHENILRSKHSYTGEKDGDCIDE